MSNKFVYTKSSEVEFLSPCFECKHKYKSDVGCKAFPVVIPDDILLGESKHTSKHPSQKNDIVFEPIIKQA